MPDRAIISLLPAVALGFICGIIVSPLQLEDGPTLAVGVVGALVVLAVGFSSVFGVRADSEEKTMVGALRGACAVGIFVCIYLFMLGFLREGSALAIIWIPLAVVFAVMLTRLRVRDRGELKRTEEPA